MVIRNAFEVHFLKDDWEAPPITLPSFLGIPKLRLIFVAVNRLIFTVLIGFLLVAASLSAQVINPPRDLGPAFRQSPKLLVGLDSRRSFISGRDVKMMGIRVGLEFDKRARVGFGVYTLASQFQRKFVQINYLGLADTVTTQLEFSYMSAYFEYILLTTKHWEVSFPIHLGVGDVGFSKVATEPQACLLGEVNVWASYKILPFLGLAGGVGYRQILLGGTAIRENFNAPTYSFGIKFWAGYFVEKIKALRKKNS